MTIDTSERRSGTGRRDAPVPFRHVGSLSSSKRDGGEQIYFIKTAGKEVLQFGDKEYFLWRALDGRNSVGEIQSKFGAKFGTPLTPEQLESFIEQLSDSGVIEPIRDTSPSKPLPEQLANPLLAEIDERADVDSLPLQFAVRFGNPTVLLRVLDGICGPLRFFRWMLLPLLIVVAVALPLQAGLVSTAFTGLNPALLAVLVVTALIVTAIVPPLAQAVVASFFGYATRSFGISLRAGLLPRLAFDDSAWGAMASRHVLGVVAAPCVAGLALFAVGGTACLASAALGPVITPFALAISFFGLASFLIGAAPFLPSHGRRFLATAFSQPDPWLAGGTYRLHMVVLSGFWLQATTGAIVLLGEIASVAWYPPPVVAVLQSIALPLLAIAPVATRLWIWGMIRSEGATRPAYGFVGDTIETLSPAIGRPREAREPAPMGAPARRVGTDRSVSNTPLIIWATLLGLLIAIAFVPYSYEAGGNFAILPADKVQVNARIQGELTEVLVNEGQRVEPGQLLGQLSDWDERYNLENARAQLENAKANLQTLFELPRPQDVELARQQFENAAAKLPYDKAQYDRYATLVGKDFVSRSNYDQVLSTYEQDKAAAEVARANYDQVRAGSTPAQIEAARASVRQYTAAVAYYEDQLERTRIRATSAGEVVTPNPQLLRGQWFNPSNANGAVVFTVEDHRTVQADVYVPETDLDHVRIGGGVRARPWGYPTDMFQGKVMAIAPDAQTDPNGGSTNVIRVRAEFPNPSGRLHPLMDGWAKMTGVYMPTWEAFTQMIIRFFMVEIWSWIP